jgi:hypothetical protein
LDAILEAAKAVVHISGVIPHLISSGVLHLQEDLALTNLKFLLLCFESMSGLRINFHKSDVLVLGVTPKEQHRIANLLICKLGYFSFHLLMTSNWGPRLGS